MTALSIIYCRGSSYALMPLCVLDTFAQFQQLCLTPLAFVFSYVFLFVHITYILFCTFESYVIWSIKIQYNTKKEFNTKEGANIMPSAAGNVAITEQHNVIQYSTMRFMLLAYCRIRYGIYIPCHWFAFSSEWGLLEFSLKDSYY